MPSYSSSTATWPTEEEGREQDVITTPGPGKPILYY